MARAAKKEKEVSLETARWPYIVRNASADDIAIIIDQAKADIKDSNPPLSR